MEHPASYKDRVDAVMWRIDAGEALGAQAWDLALEGLRDGCDPQAVIHACVCAAHVTNNTEPERAINLLKRAGKFARAHQLESDALGLRLRVAEAHLCGGEHARGFEQLVAMAGSPRLHLLDPATRSRLFMMLAVHSLPVDPDDSVSLCLGLASQAFGECTNPLRLNHLAWALSVRMMRLTLAHPALNTTLVRPHWAPDRYRRETMALAQNACAALAQPGWEKAAVCCRSWVETIASLAPGLAARDIAQVRGTLQMLRRLPDDDPHQEEDCRYWVIAALLELGDAEAAHAALLAMEPVVATDHWAVRLNWLHLRSAVARARGDTPAALSLYETYVLAASRQLPRMNVRVPQLLNFLVRLPGARPSDAASERPAYLERALAHAADAGALVSVSSLAAAAGVAERTLREAFVNHLGLGPKEFLLRQRLEAARALLEESHRLSVEEAAARLGFSNSGRFSAMYRRAFGHSPADVRTRPDST